MQKQLRESLERQRAEQIAYSAEFAREMETRLFDGEMLPNYILYSLEKLFERDLRICATNDERQYLRAGLRKIKLNLMFNWLANYKI